MLPTRVNGQPAAIAYTRDPSGDYTEDGVVVLTVTGDGISEITSFGDPSLLRVFGFPPIFKAVASID